MILLRKIIVSCIIACAYSSAYSETPSLPKNIIEQLPKGYVLMTMQTADLNSDKLMDYIVVMHKEDEKEIYQRTEQAPRRPLLIFTRKSDNTFILSARNDHVVYTVDEGGQCDPFLDSGEGITVKGIFFTVENGVACGSHWTDYITFKYSSELKNWVFHKRIYEKWVMNSSRNPNADALVLSTRNVMSSKKGTLLLLQDYKRD